MLQLIHPAFPGAELACALIFNFSPGVCCRGGERENEAKVQISANLISKHCILLVYNSVFFSTTAYKQNVPDTHAVQLPHFLYIVMTDIPAGHVMGGKACIFLSVALPQQQHVACSSSFASNLVQGVSKTMAHSSCQSGCREPMSPHSHPPHPLLFPSCNHSPLWVLLEYSVPKWQRGWSSACPLPGSPLRGTASSSWINHGLLTGPKNSFAMTLVGKRNPTSRNGTATESNY